MARYTHEQLMCMSRPASDTEETKMENARNAIMNALSQSEILKSNAYEVFGQGSYANNTNIRNNSDIDINVCYTDAYYFDLPENVTRQELGLNNSVEYSYQSYKNDIEKMLIQYFGAANVVRKNKCIHINGNSYRAEIDVVPTWKYRRFSDKRGTYKEGVLLYSDDYQRVINYPKQHLNNGICKNNDTLRRYKRLVRIIKNLKKKMEDANYYKNDSVTSFLIEGLVYNYPNAKYLLSYSSFDWNTIIRDFIYYFWNGCSAENEAWKGWVEPSECLYLMYGHKWKHSDVKEFMYNLWNFLQYN